MERDRVSAIEVYCELFSGHPKDVDKDTRFINSVLSQLPGWKKQTVRVGVDYGPVKGFIHAMRYRP
jgi:hypothetical protein